MMKVLELFSGTASFSNVAKEFGHETFTVDWDYTFEPDLWMDIRFVNPKMLLEHFGKPDIIWASPDCKCFSVASIGTHWMGGKEAYIPRTEDAKFAIELVSHAWKLVNELSPKYWIFENPRGLLRKLNILPTPYLKTVWYCQYGDVRAKPTDLWTNIDFDVRTCFNGCTDHQEARRGAKTGTQGLEKIDRSKIPRQLCIEILDGCI